MSINPLYADPVWLANAINTKSIYDIAAECGAAHSTIRKYLKRFGIKSRSISEAMKLKYQDQEYLDKRREQWHSEEYTEQQRNGIDKERSSETSKKLWQDKNFVDKCLAAHSEALKRPEVRESFSRASKRNWQNEDYKAKQANSIRHKLTSERLKKQWNNHEYRRRMTEQSNKLWLDGLYRESQRQGLLKISALLSEYSKNAWKNESYRLAVSKRGKSPESRLKRSIKMKKYYIDHPEYKNVVSESSKSLWKSEEYRQKIVGVYSLRFKQKAIKKHCDNFDYSESDYNISDKAKSRKVKMKCNICGHSFLQRPTNHLVGSTCPYCHSSQGQREVYNFVRSLGFDAVLNDRSKIYPLELDIFIPDKNFAIEYHGLWWHSYDRPETKDERFRLQNKAIKCSGSNIQLLQFFDFQWENKKDIVKSMIRHKLGLSEHRFFARDLKVIDSVDNKLAREFFDSNHLFGNRDASKVVGLFLGDLPIMMLSVSNGEIIRFAAALGCSVCGGLSRLLKRVSVNRTYADLCFSNAVGYFATGFKSIGATKPGYFYYKGDVILSRQQCQKHKLGKFLEVFDENLSESVNMFVNGYRRVWNAGNLRLVK